MTPVIVALFDDYGINEFDSVRKILHRNKPVAVEEIR